MARYAQTGDNALLEALYDQCADDLYHFLLTQSDPVTAKDICQKSWLKVIEKRHLYQQSGRFIAWLFTLARHALIDEHRKTQRIDYREDELLHVHVSFEHTDNIKDAFEQILLALPFEQREAFCLQQEGFGLQEIAQITQVGLETIKSRIRYAKQNLRNQLEKYHD